MLGPILEFSLKCRDRMDILDTKCKTCGFRILYQVISSGPPLWFHKNRFYWASTPKDAILMNRQKPLFIYIGKLHFLGHENPGMSGVSMVDKLKGWHIRLRSTYENVHAYEHGIWIEGIFNFVFVSTIFFMPFELCRAFKSWNSTAAQYIDIV